MRKLFVALTGLLLISIVVQFYFAAFAVFTTPDNDSQFLLHQMNGRIAIPLLTLLVTGAAALARAPGRLIGFSLLPLGLLVVQILLFFLAAAVGSTEERTNVAGQIILGLHAVNGLAILWVTLLLYRRARAHARGITEPAEPAGSAAAPVAAEAR